MTEWQLQHELTRRWRSEPLPFQGRNYNLVCWELMFPSWRINDKRFGFAEPSIDFVLFDGAQTFLCLEVKKEICSRKDLMVALCQVSHLAIEFLNGYSVQKLAEARTLCFQTATEERGGIKKNINHQSYPSEVLVKRVLGAKHLHKDTGEWIRALEELDWEELHSIVSKHTSIKPMQRLLKQGEEAFIALMKQSGGCSAIELMP